MYRDFIFRGEEAFKLEHMGKSISLTPRFSEVVGSDRETRAVLPAYA
jgi:hypothetical protein